MQTPIDPWGQGEDSNHSYVNERGATDAEDVQTQYQWIDELVLLRLVMGVYLTRL
jgi:hypothetical protein